MNNSDLIKSVSNFVTQFLIENLSHYFYFHNLQHTKEVVAAANEIAAQHHLSEEECTILLTAAWFHDCGYTVTYIGHEEKSKKIATNFLKDFGCDETFINSVLNCIEATKFPQRANSLLEEILCDADLYHFTKPNYPAYEQALRKEFEIHLGKNYTDEQWQKENYSLLAEHSYYTNYGKKVMEKYKAATLQLLNNKAK